MAIWKTTIFRCSLWPAAMPALTRPIPRRSTLDRVARDFPTLKIISAHGNWPWVSQIIHVCYRRPNIYLSPDMYMHGNFPGAQDYLNALNGFLADRFLYASAYPFLSVREVVGCVPQNGDQGRGQGTRAIQKRR